MKRREITKKMLNNLPDFNEIERHKRGATCYLAHKFPEWFLGKYPEQSVQTNTYFTIRMDPALVCREAPEHMADVCPNILIQYRPEWMCNNKPEWVFENRPDILFDKLPHWVAQNKPEWVAFHRFHWMQENYPALLEKTLPDPGHDEPEWVKELITKYNKQP